MEELNDLKSAWAQYDKRLDKALRLNEELLRSINLDKYNRALKKPINLELLNIFIQVIMIGLVVVFTFRLSNEISYFIIGLISSAVCLISLTFSSVKVYRFSNLSYSQLSITHFQKDFAQLRIFIMRLRKIEYVMAAILGITLFPLMVKATAGIDLLGNLTVLIPAICCALGLGYAIGIWLNLIVYDKGLKDAEKFLSLIDNFAKEE
ncbi:MAG TPA: hypothetical protein VK155_19930 [Bacteroidales bacterium]|nr:hypothetical protein [Bacteroidales bacterium]